MQFSDVIGQEKVKQQLLLEIEEEHLPHALLLCGPEGNGGYALALAIADKLLSINENGKAMVAKMEHPDLHFSFPVYKVKPAPAKNPSDIFISEWRGMVLENPYFGYSEWMSACRAENQQLQMYVEESDSLIRKLSLKASQGKYKVVIIWLPEKMNESCANKLLKLLEEPPAGTKFIMVCEHPEQLLSTISSRTQVINVPPMAADDIKEALMSKYNVSADQAQIISRTCGGNFSAALRNISDDSELELFFDKFVELMRLAYVRKVKEMKLWSEDVATFGRERQKRFLEYCQRMVRENFIYNFNKPEIVYLNEKERNFAIKFAPYINEKNVIGIMEELGNCQRDIVQNGNPKIVFFDFALKMIVLIKNR